MLLVAAAIRIAVWRPSPRIPADDRLLIFLAVYSILLGSYVILATVAWFTRELKRFPIVLCLGSAANVAFGIYCDFQHFLRSERSGWHGGLDALTAFGQIIVVLCGLLFVAFLFGLSAMVRKDA